MRMSRLTTRLVLPITLAGVACAFAIFFTFKYALEIQEQRQLHAQFDALDEAMRGFLALDTAPAALQRAASLLAATVGGATVSVIDAADRRVVASSRREWTGRPAAELAEFPAAPPSGDPMGTSGEWLQHVGALGPAGSEHRYELWVRVPRHLIGVTLRTLSSLAIAVLVLCLLGVLWVTLRVVRRDVLQPVAALHRYAAGESAASEEPLRRADELGDLARTVKSLLRDRLYQQKREAESAKHLAKALEFTRQIVDQAPDAVLTCDTAGNIDSFNPAAEEIFGIDADFAVTTQLGDVLPSLRLPLPPGCGSRTEEASVRLRDGSSRDLALSVSEARWADTVRYTIMARDVTAHKRIESALRDSERRMRQLIATAYEGIITLDAGLAATECNPRLAEILGTAPEAIIGRDFAAFVADRYRPGLKSALAACLEGRPLAEREVLLRSRRGDSVWGLVSATAVGGGDDPLRLYLMVTDISALKATQADLIDSRRRLELAMSTGDVGIWGYHAGSGQVEFDDSSVRLIGWRARAEVPADLASWVEGVHPDDRAGLLAALGDHAAGVGGEYSVEFRYRTVNAGYRWFRSRGRAVEHGGESRGAHIVGIQQDISEEKALTENLAHARDEALAAAKTKAEFLANMSHELRTPLNGVLGMLSLVDAAQMGAEQRGYVEVATRSARNLLQLINNILDFSKMEARKVEIENIEFDLRLLAEDVTELLAEPAHQKGIDITLLYAAGVRSWVTGDPGRVRQILVNLIGNSIKFTNRGEIVLEIKRGQLVQQALRFEIRDTGIGIEPAQQQHIFDAFRQGDGSTTRRFGGTGLGLSITRELVSLMGGVIGLDSTPGTGSTFWFEIVLPQAHEAVPAGSPPPAFAGHRVLVHDLSPTTCTALRQQFESWGVEVETLPALDELLPVLRDAARANRPFYAAILDVFAEPETLVRTVRALHGEPALAATRVVVTTLFGRPGDAGQLRRAGVHAYLTKPVRADQLARTFSALISGAGEGALITRHSLAEAALSGDLSVLVVDDVGANLKVASAMLTKLGARAEVAISADEALFALGRTNYDLVFMDCQMPEMDGLAATAEIRSRFAPAHGPVVIAMTAHASSADRDRCLHAGMDDFMTKPITLEALAAMLAKWSPIALHGAAVRSGDIDGVKSAELRELLGPAGYRELIDRFASDARAALDRMRAAHAGGRSDELGIAAHALRGSGLNIGARRLAELCAALEGVLRQSGGEDVETLLERIGSVLDTTIGELQALERIAA
ncbi:MAG: PAS domain S-box protein [Gammaproteobacteria bacterium]|nr:PAS domain S-box protein [Gammaproteobacteria bacterium]